MDASSSLATSVAECLAKALGKGPSRDCPDRFPGCLRTTQRRLGIQKYCGKTIPQQALLKTSTFALPESSPPEALSASLSATIDAARYQPSGGVYRPIRDLPHCPPCLVNRA